MLTISSNSLDELNSAYKKLKAQYKAQDKIKLDTDRCNYIMYLNKIELNPMVKNLLEKAIDICDEELAEIKTLDTNTFLSFMKEHENKYVFIKQMKDIWVNLSLNDMAQIIEYLSEQLNIEQENEELGVEMT